MFPRILTYSVLLVMDQSSDPSLTVHSSGSTIPDALSVEEYGRLFNAYREGSESSLPSLTAVFATRAEPREMTFADVINLCAFFFNRISAPE